ncbi:HNH endonuclease [Bacillus tropicus]|uniref:HNH endonuclease n=1 Tax=Bacillus tropicus TaxID=2026188 RepID=UPI0034E4EDE2
MQVYHLKELSQLDEEYEINPIEDLRSACPNCHTMLHKRKPAYSIKGLQERMKLKI